MSNLNTQSLTKIYSKKDPNNLLHMIVHKSMLPEGRTDLCEPHEFIQCAGLRPERGTKYRPHKHIWNEYKGDKIAQESWVVITGLVKVYFYDTDDTLIHMDLLAPGDASFTFEGGHTYEILSENTFVYEYKTGPYYGQEMDKEFI